MVLEGVHGDDDAFRWVSRRRLRVVLRGGDPNSVAVYLLICVDRGYI
jgi:hypothetical protein